MPDGSTALRRPGALARMAVAEAQIQGGSLRTEYATRRLIGRGGKFVVMIPAQYVENFRGAPGIEVIGDNGKNALLGWTP